MNESEIFAAMDDALFDCRPGIGPVLVGEKSRFGVFNSRNQAAKHPNMGLRKVVCAGVRGGMGKK